jgi:heterotetrameric sarcosine oxidase gamma subunit
VSAPEIGVRIGDCALGIVELAAFRDQAARLGSLLAARGVSLPERGRISRSTGRMIIAARPDRWLLLGPPEVPGALAQSWQAVCGGCAAVVEHSAALSAVYATGPAMREMLKRGCRLDLDPRAFPAGAAGATLMAQVSVTVAMLASGVLLLTPASTARHFREWLAAAAKPFGLGSLGDVTVAALSGEPIT